MPTNLTCLKVFIASPSGLSDERRTFRDEIKQYNESDAIPRGVFFEPVGWEDTLGRVGRPQSIINEDVRESDYFVLLLWDRWGSPPDTKVDQPFSSGTEEEYHVALKCHGDGALPMRQLVLMFKAVDARQLSDPGRQLDKVLEFREKIESGKSHLFHSFDTPEGFRILLRRHLADWLRDQENGPGGDGENQAEALDMVSVEPVKEDPVISGPPEPLTAKAWSLADAGRLTKAEVEFARSLRGSNFCAVSFLLLRRVAACAQRVAQLRLLVTRLNLACLCHITCYEQGRLSEQARVSPRPPFSRPVCAHSSVSG